MGMCRRRTGDSIWPLIETRAELNMATAPNFSQPAIFSEVSTPVAPDSGYLKVYGKAGALCSIANGGSEKAYVTSSDLSAYLPLAGGTLVGDLKFTDATYDIGKSGATRPRDGFFSRNVVIGGTSSINNSGLSARYSLNVGTSSFAGLVDSEVVAGFYNAVFSGTNARISVIAGSGGEASLYLGDYSTIRVKLTSASAGVLEQRDGTIAQTFRLAETYSSSTSFGALQFSGVSGGNYRIGPAIGSAGGTSRAIDFGYWSSAGVWQGALMTIDPVASTVTIGSTKTLTVTYITLTSGGQIRGNSGNITLTDHATANDFSLLRFGGATSSYPAIKRSSAAIALRLADDSADAALTCGAITASSIIRQSAEITSTPSGTTQTLTLNNGNHQTLTLTSSTGDVTVTLTVPTSSSAGTLIINQHGTTPRDITWAVSSGTIKWMGTEPTWASDAVNDVRIVSWRWNGSVMYLASTDVGT